jgi:hypothetical protein
LRIDARKCAGIPLALLLFLTRLLARNLRNGGVASQEDESSGHTLRF